MIDAAGQISRKAQELDWLANNPWSGTDDFRYTIADIVFADDDTAIIFGHGDSTRANDAGEPCHHRYWSSNTLVRRGGRWRPVLSHVSGVSCESR